MLILLDKLLKFISSQKTKSRKITLKLKKKTQKQAQVICITKVHNLILAHMENSISFKALV